MSRDSLCIEFHGVLAMILRDTQSRARVSFFLYLLFRHAISPLVSANCLSEVLPIVTTVIYLCSSRCGKMIESKGEQLILIYDYYYRERERQTEGFGDFLSRVEKVSEYHGIY